MIWDLIDISASACFNRRPAGYRNKQRMQGNILNLLNNGDDRLSEQCNDDDIGMSILYIDGDARDREFE